VKIVEVLNRPSEFIVEVAEGKDRFPCYQIAFIEGDVRASYRTSADQFWQTFQYLPTDLLPFVMKGKALLDHRPQYRSVFDKDSVWDPVEGNPEEDLLDRIRGSLRMGGDLGSYYNSDLRTMIGVLDSRWRSEDYVQATLIPARLSAEEISFRLAEAHHFGRYEITQAIQTVLRDLQSTEEARIRGRAWVNRQAAERAVQEWRNG